MQMDPFVVRGFDPSSASKRLSRRGWGRGMWEVNGRISSKHRHGLIHLLLGSYSEIGIFHHSDSSCGHQSTRHLPPTRGFVSVEIQPFVGRSLIGREFISGLEFDSKGIYLASVTNIGCLTVHDFETLYCTNTSFMEHDVKPVLHISTGEKLDAVHWNPTNQDEVGCVSERRGNVFLYDISCVTSVPSEVLKRKVTSSMQHNLELIGFSDLAFSWKDKSKVIACGLDGSINLWDRRASKFSCSAISVPHPSNPLNSLQLTAEEQVIFVGSENGNVYAWDLRGGRTSVAFLSNKEVYHPPLATIKITSLLDRISALKAQTEIRSSGIQSININPSCGYQLAFHLNSGWSGVLNLNNVEVTHIHCPPPPWLEEYSPVHNCFYKRKATWLPTDSIYVVGSSVENGMNILDFSMDPKSPCYVDYDSDGMQTDFEDKDGYLFNKIVGVSDFVVVCAAHPLNTSIVGGTEGGSLLLIAQKHKSVSGEESPCSDEQEILDKDSEMS